MLKIFVPTKSNFYASWIQARTEVEFVDEIKDANMILFTGGEDVDPSVYGDNKHHTTYSNTQRDSMEIAVYKTALSRHIPMLGICRGAQLLTALQPKGFLIQNVTNHGMMHQISFPAKGFDEDDDNEYFVTSTHHQMMYPFNIRNYNIIAYSTDNISKVYETGGGPLGKGSIDCEPEVVYYPDTNCLAIQGHPEMMSSNNPTVEKLFTIVVDKLQLKL